MSRKTQVAYEAAFKYIEEHIFKLSDCASFTTDFEVAMRQAIRSLNSIARLYACHFHFCQAGKRRAAQTDGFVKMLSNSKDAASIYYRLLCLPLLPEQFINDSFEQLQTEAFALNRRGFKTYFGYYRRQWIVRVCIYNRFTIMLLFVIHTNSMFMFHFYCLFRKGRIKYVWMVQKWELHLRSRHTMVSSIKVLWIMDTFSPLSMICAARNSWREKNLKKLSLAVEKQQKKEASVYCKFV